MTKKVVCLFFLKRKKKNIKLGGEDLGAIGGGKNMTMMYEKNF